MTVDKRRAQYVPLDTRIAFGKTAERLKKKYGKDGLLTWVLFLAAAKRANVQGVFEYTSEVEGWQLLGLPYPDTPGFSLDAFFGFTGRGGGTRLVRHGSCRRVSVVNWKSWNDEWKKQQGSERNTRKQEENAREIGAESAHGARTEVEGEVDLEVEGEVEAVRNGPGFFSKQAAARLEKLMDTTPVPAVIPVIATREVA